MGRNRCLLAIIEIRTARETPPLLALRGHEKGQSKVWPSGIGGVQFTTEQLTIGANEHCCGYLRQRAHEPSITRATSP